jgi:hypothetical protein
MGGAAGPGKTDCLVMDATRFVECDGYRGLLLRRTYPQLQEIADRCWQWYPKMGAEFKASEKRWYWPNGAFVQLGHVQHETSKYDYQGRQYHYVGFDELTQFTETQYTYILSRIRMPPPGVTLAARATTNPGGVGHVWVKNRFIDQMPPLTTYVDADSGQSRCFVPATLYDNPTLIREDPLYIRRLESLPEIEKLRLLHGVWDVFEGQAFTELSQLVHGCEDFPIPGSWEKFTVFDWGFSRPWCMLFFAIDFDGTMYVYREHYGMGGDGTDPNKGVRQNNDEICNKIIELEREKYQFRLADPACWSPTKIRGSNAVHGPSFVEDASRHNLFFMQADNDRIRGRQQVHQRLRVESIADQEGEIIEERPRIVIFNSCKRLWEELTSLKEDEKNPEDVDTNQPDDGYDCLRYGCMARPIIPKVEHSAPPGSFQAERNRYIKARKLAQRKGISLAAAYARVRG